MSNNAESSGNSAVAGPTSEDADNFFGALDDEVNEAKDVVESKEQVTSNNWNSDSSNQTQDNTDWQKRYKDSTRSAQKMAGKLKELEPFSALLNVMRKDSGLVDHVKNYLEGGGKAPKNVKEALDLPDDFDFDANEAFNDPESKSGQVFETMMDNYVTNRVGEMMNVERQKAAVAQKEVTKNMEAHAFKEKHNLSNEQFQDFVEKTKNYKLTFEDAFHLVNRDQANTNIANSTRQDMLKQMKNVRGIPNTASASNNAGQSQTMDEAVFDLIKTVDNDVDNLFG